jgi:regulator of protease activity HflC (stomatin/prohibitin superfamily)
MIISGMLGGFAGLLWVVLLVYVIWVFIDRARGGKSRISISTAVSVLLLALATSTLSAGLVVIDASEVGVVFNAFSGTREEPLYPGTHFVIPYVETVYRYSTLEQVYTMSMIHEEGDVMGDDSLWSPTSEGLQVGVDSSTRYKVDPSKAAYIHNNFRKNYVEVLVRPTIRSKVRLFVSQHTVTDVYGPKRTEIQANIEQAIRERFEGEGLLLLSFDIRNVNFTEEYARSIEQKQIAQQQAEQMQFVLQREQQEAERKRVEAKGVKDAAIIKAQGEAESLRLINEQLADNDRLLVYRYIEKLSPNIQVMLLPSGSPFIVDLQQLMGRGQAAAPATAKEPAASPPVPAPTPLPTPTAVP